MSSQLEMRMRALKARGYTNAEVAAVLGIPEEKVRKLSMRSSGAKKSARADWNRQSYLAIAKQLGYPPAVQEKLKLASSGIEADRIMATARHEAIERERGLTWI